VGTKLEILRQMDEEIMESLKEAERDIRMEMEHQLVSISELKRQLSDSDKRGEDLELVIRKFRQKQADLNEVIQQQKDEVGGHSGYP
jgi:chromosome segregation ATPase